MDEANSTLAPGQDAQPSRLIIEVKNPADATIAQYFQTHHYETEGNGLDDGKAAWFLQLLTGIVSTVGGVICLLAFYLLSLSIFLLLQKNATKLENLLLVGYTPSQVAFPYQALAVGLNTASLLAAFACMVWARDCYLATARALFPQLESETPWAGFLTGFCLWLLAALLNMALIRRKVRAIGLAGAGK